MKQSWKFLQYEQIFSTVQQNWWNSPFTMAIRCPRYGDVTWIEPMVVINSQRNRTFDGCTVMHGNQSVSKISLWYCSVPNLLTGKCSQCWICVFTECQGGDTPYTLARRFLSTRERRHVPSHVPFQQRHMTTQVTFFNMARPSWPNPSSAIAQGYVVSTHKRSDNLRCVKEIHELVIRKVSAQFSTWRGPLGRIHRVQWSTAMLSVHTNTVTICDL